MSTVAFKPVSMLGGNFVGCFEGFSDIFDGIFDREQVTGQVEGFSDVVRCEVVFGWMASIGGDCNEVGWISRTRVELSRLYRVLSYSQALSSDLLQCYFAPR